MGLRYFREGLRNFWGEGVEKFSGGGLRYFRGGVEKFSGEGGGGLKNFRGLRHFRGGVEKIQGWLRFFWEGLKVNFFSGGGLIFFGGGEEYIL